MKYLFFLLGAGLLTSSCTTSKFDYHTAYRFSYTNQQESAQPATQQKQKLVMVDQLLASTKPVSSSVQVGLPDKIDIQPNKVANTSNLMETYENASKAEKRAIRKQVKEDYKTLRKEYQQTKKEAAAKDVAFNKKMYIGLVVFGAGLLIAILVSGGGALGAVGMIVGIGLIAWGFIEQA